MSYMLSSAGSGFPSLPSTLSKLPSTQEREKPCSSFADSRGLRVLQETCSGVETMRKRLEQLLHCWH